MSDTDGTTRRCPGSIDRETEPFLERRREFLRTVGTAGALTALGASGAGVSTAQENGDRPIDGDPFTLGVASGEPFPDSVVLWTRIAPEPLEGDGGMPDRQVPVQWQVATDRTSGNSGERLEDIVRSGSTKARPELAHSVHVEVDGLDPDTEYYYQFAVGPDRSPIGRTKTVPEPGSSVDEFSFAFASCQNYPRGYYTAHEHLAEEDLDLAVHLGDYIYEGGAQGPFERGHEPAREIESLSDYRVRHAQYKTDQNLQDAHAAFPWLVAWDDHELENNWADEISQNEDPPEEFLERRANAFQAYFEHQPLRPSRMPEGSDLRLYRRFTVGDLAEFNVLDTRQYRDDQVDTGEEASASNRTILGDEQENWLIEGLNDSSAQWNVLANQVPVAATDENADPDVRDFGGGDKWDGYRADRQALLDVMAQDPDLNPVVVTGDVHRNYAYDLKADFSDPDSETVGTEYVGTSISSFGDGSGITQYGPSIGEPWQRFFNDDRGYVRCTITPERWQTDYRVVSTVEEPEASVRTVASFATDAGEPGAELISERPDSDQQSAVEIAEIQANAPGRDGDNLDGEFATVKNTGDAAIDFSGFVLSFEGGNAQNYTFGDFTLEAGETVTVRNGSGEDTSSTLYTGFDGAVLNNGSPDTVLVANEDGIVLDEASYSSS